LLFGAAAGVIVVVTPVDVLFGSSAHEGVAHGATLGVTIRALPAAGGFLRKRWRRWRRSAAGS
jgi:hypothetical protein